MCLHELVVDSLLDGFTTDLAVRGRRGEGTKVVFNKLLDKGRSTF